MDVIWKSDLPNNLKRRFFWATVEVVLMYDATAWTLIETLESKLDGTYTRMLRDNIHLNHNSMDPPVIFLQTYANTECILQESADKQNKTSWVIYCSGHLAMEQDRLITQQLPTLTSYDTECLPNDIVTLIRDQDGWHSIDSWMTELTRPNKKNRKKLFLLSL